jgi:hypothetical protein
MDLKFYDHNGRRWMEGEFEGRWFALNEEGNRLVLETPLYGFGCFMGMTLDDFSGHRVGVLGKRVDACMWLMDIGGQEPQRIDRPNQKRRRLTVPLGASEVVPC